MFKIQITRYEQNEHFEADLADYKDRSRYGNTRIDNSDYPRKEIMRNVMEVMITEEQFEAIRKAVLENF